MKKNIYNVNLYLCIPQSHGDAKAQLHSRLTLTIHGGEWLFYHWYPVQSWSEHCGEEKLTPKIKQFLGHPANSLVTIPNKLLENYILFTFYFSNRNKCNANSTFSLGVHQMPSLIQKSYIKITLKCNSLIN